MESKFTYSSKENKDCVTFTVTMTEQEYADAVRLVPLGGELQGLEHTGGLQETLTRLAEMVKKLDA